MPDIFMGNKGRFVFYGMEFQKEILPHKRDPVIGTTTENRLNVIAKRFSCKFPLNLLLILITGFFIFSFAKDASAEWVSAGYGIKETYAKVVVVDSSDSNVIYAATDYFLYVSGDKGANWQEVFTLPGKDNAINFVAVSRYGQPVVFVAAKDGLYSSSDGLENWQKIYSGSGEGEKSINCVALDAQRPDFLYIASDNGVFVSKDKGKAFEDISGGLGRVAVKYMAIDPSGNIIYISTADRIFKSENNGATWQNVYTIFKADTAESDSGEETPEETEESFANINSLALNPLKPEEIYAATSKGVLVSKNKGKDWYFMTNLGLDNSDVRFVLLESDLAYEKIYAATYRGVFEYDQNQQRWLELYKGASFRDARFLSIDTKGSILWAATGNGIFKADIRQTAALVYGKMEIPEEIASRFKNEPTITQVQRAAIKYAEVYPEKIIKWRREAKFKAFMPEVGLSYDKTVSVYEKNNFTVGPKDWGVDFSWDVGDLIYNSDQTSIDVRSRLMVELRDDVLDDVTRLYYERRRLQVEMFMSAPKSEKERYDKILRLEELTAGIDALTGGYFSAPIERVI